MTTLPTKLYPERCYGAKYDATKDLCLKEIAKLVRKDLKDKFGSGWKFSVRTRHYAGGRSLDVDVKTSPTPLRGAHTEEHGWFTPEGAEAHKAIEAILAAYNYDGSNCLIDYYDVRFYSHVSF